MVLIIFPVFNCDDRRFEEVEAVTIVETMPEMRNHIVLFQFLVRSQDPKGSQGEDCAARTVKWLPIRVQT